MSRVRIRHHVNPLNASFFRDGVGLLALPEAGEVEVELGCADARFLFERARALPVVRCVGLEIRRDLVDEVNEKAVAEGLGNLSAVFGNANVDFERLFPDGRLARVFINFPDPWFKQRHHKRRVTTPELVAVIHRKLAPGGALFFQSDVFDLALDAMAVIEESGLFENQTSEWGFALTNPYGARSLREVYTDEDGLRVWRMLYRRR